MKNKLVFVFDSQLIFIPLFWGSLWGVAEATLGHLLHLAGFPGLAGMVMFPLGLFFMTRSFSVSGHRMTIVFTALVACSIKLFDLFFPVLTPFVVLNPAIAILFESLAVVLFLPGKIRSGYPVRLGSLLGMTLSWRVFYAVFVMGLSLFFPVKTFLNLGLSYAVHFFLLESIISGVLIFLLFQSSVYSRVHYSGGLSQLSKRYVSVFVFLAVVIMKLMV